MSTLKNPALLTLWIEDDIKKALKNIARHKGMDMSKLTRAIVTNYIKPGTYRDIKL